MLKRTTITVLVFGLILSPFVIDATGPVLCEIRYDTSFNGLYIIKQEVCFGTFIGLEHSRTTLDRKPMFEEF